MSRFLRFNAVSAGGFVIQLSTVALLTFWLAIPDVAATGAGVAAAIVHNFLWHRRWTWSDRFLDPGGFAPADPPTRSLAGAPMPRSVRAGSLTLAECGLLTGASVGDVVERTATDRSSDVAMFLRFVTANGLISIAGNLLIVAVLVERTIIDVVGANVVAVAICGLLNYQIGDRLVFRPDRHSVVR